MVRQSLHQHAYGPTKSWQLSDWRMSAENTMSEVMKEKKEEEEEKEI